MQVLNQLKSLSNTILDIFYPPQCMLCKEFVENYATCCAECYKKLSFLSRPYCHYCGLPFEGGPSYATTCATCIKAPPLYYKARHLLAYDDISKPLILRLKYNKKTQLSPMLSRWMVRLFHEIEMNDTPCIITPVPLHKKRLAQRSFNQSQLIAKYSAKHFPQLTLISDLLIRKKPTIRQTGLTKEQRIRNLQGAFTPNQRYLGKFKHLPVILIDDVYTTGSTVHGCCYHLKRMGFKTIYVLTVARRY